MRTDLTRFADAVADLDEAIVLMQPTGASETTGVARYREYPDAFVQRGLAREGLRYWRGALADYDQAVALWGGLRAGEAAVNPFALTYRGRAKTELVPRTPCPSGQMEMCVPTVGRLIPCLRAPRAGRPRRRGGRLPRGRVHLFPSRQEW